LLADKMHTKRNWLLHISFILEQGAFIVN